MSGVRYDDPAVARDFETVRYQREVHSLGPWLDRVGAWFEVSRPQTRVLDLGAGTGVWSEAIAERFQVEVVGVEPGAGMRAQAANRRSPLVSFVGGSAGAIPLADDSATSAWLSTVIHHFPDLDAAAGELRRVLPTRAPLLIRNWYSDRLDGMELIRHFPTVLERLSAWKSRAEVVAVLEGNGFELAGIEAVSGPAYGYDDILRALPGMRATDSTLVGVGDDEWEAGLASIRRSRDRGDAPRQLGLDLVVFR